MSDLIVTWPKSRPFGSYVAECAKADSDGLYINYRIHSSPDPRRLNLPHDRRLYRVHDGVVRGYTRIRTITFHDDRSVVRVESDPLTGFWPAGWYIVCHPRFHDCPPLAMDGFRGYRYFERSLVEGH